MGLLPAETSQPESESYALASLKLVENVRFVECQPSAPTNEICFWSGFWSSVVLIPLYKLLFKLSSRVTFLLMLSTHNPLDKSK